MNQPIDINHAFRVIELALSASHDCLATDNVNAVGDGYHWRINNSDALAMLDALKEATRSEGTPSSTLVSKYHRRPDVEWVMESGKTIKIYIRG